MDKQSSALAAMRKLYSLFTPQQKRSFAGLLVLTFLSSLSDLLGLSLLIPVVGLVLSDGFFQNYKSFIPLFSGYNKETLLLYTLVAFFVLIVIKNIFTLYVNSRQVNFVRKLFLSSATNMLQNIYGRSITDIQKTNSNGLIHKLINYQILLSSNLALPTIIVINESIIFTLTIILVSIWNWQLLLLLMIVLGPTVGLFYYRARKTMQNAGSEFTQSIIRMQTHTQTMIFGYTDIKITGASQNFEKAYEALANEMGNYQKKKDLLGMIPPKIIEIAVFLCAIVILLYGIFVLKDVEQIVTTISLFSVIAYRITPSIQRLVMAFNNIHASSFVLYDADMLHTKPVALKQQPLSFNKHLRLYDLTYTYPGEAKPVLNGCDLEIKKGTTVGFIGRSGAGKSTLVHLLLGYLQPTGGNIEIDGTPLAENNTESWWKLLGYVRQDVYIMNATIMENIALGIAKEDVDIKRLDKAIELASLSEYISSKPLGVHTMITENGNNLSGGQKQRIAIARAIYKGAEVLVFDEATSSLDNNTEEEITRAIYRLGQEHLTIIIIAHRHTSLKHCDKICLLENGRVSRTFTYEELAATK